MHRIRDSLALSRFAKSAFCAVLISLFAFAARAEESGSVEVYGGGTVVYENADEVKLVYNEETHTNDLVLIYSNANVTGASFTLPDGYKTKARILAVGGGGGGGGSYASAANNQPYGGGGGGGAGGVVDTNSMFSAGEYLVVVGDGGPGGANKTTHNVSSDYSGSDGSNTTVSIAGEYLITAYGGGGGGGETDGHAGGSGGGGSMYRVNSTTGTAHDGGACINGQGNVGGNGDAYNFGGGGGGAGGPGANASNDAHGVGGVGVANDITGALVWYAGGGGGGCNKPTASAPSPVPGGDGGGGAGGSGATDPEPGTDGLGGGGGGSRRGSNLSGARGGCGTVIVRISEVLGADLIKPPSLMEKVFNNGEQTSISNTAYYTVSGANVGTRVGEYVATATLIGGHGYKWLDEDGHELDDNPAVVTMRITKVWASFSNLSIRDWMYGTPSAATPNPKCSPSPEWVVPKYEYADSKDAAEWSSEKPTALGTHWVRVRPPNDADYDYDIDDPNHYASFEIFNGHGSTFTDYVKITIEGRSGDALDEFPYEVTLSEKVSQNGLSYPEGTAYAASDLVGFLYDRAGSTGEDIAFTDMDGNFLPFKVKEWNVDGESKVHVKISHIGTESQTIMLYWHLRDGQVAPDHDPDSVFSNWTEEAAAAAGQPNHAFGLVNRDNKDVNYFTQLPKMDKQSWNVGNTPGSVTVDAMLADGNVLETVLDSFGNVLPGIPSAAIGAYRIVFSPDDPDGEYEELAYGIDFSITGDTATSDLSGGLTGEFALTLNGRVMLANDDDGDEGHMSVSGQAFWRTEERSPKVFWVHSDDSRDIDPNKSTTFDNNVRHELNVAGDGTAKVLWRLYNASIGNGFNVSGGFPADNKRSALPWSDTSLGSRYENKDVHGANTESANIVLRNMIGSVVYSPCYTNGIGTIYFDALNQNAVGIGGYLASYHRIVVEVATATDDGLDPTDENAGWSNMTPQNMQNTATWRRCKMLPLKRDGTPSFVADAKTEELALGIATAKDSKNFYRICVKVEERGPVRFRIRRTGYAPNEAFDVIDERPGKDYGGLILLDNIIVSYPSCTADMEPYGKYDSARGGSQVLGQECAMANVPFPSVTDAGNLVGRGKLTTYVSGATNVSAASFVQEAKMLYRWRYLNQRTFPDDGAWNGVELSPFSGTSASSYTATGPLSVTNEPGDIEFLYELKTSMPYYKYTDYSGQDLALGDLYTEEEAVVTNRIATSSRLPTCGTDWFVRLREGASVWEGVSVVLSGGGFDESSIAMELVADNTWRGIAKVPSGASGTVSFRFEGANRQEAGAETVSENSTTWGPKGSLDALPGHGEAAEGGYEGTFPADTASRYLEFMFNDETLVYSVGHAEYQDFNGWHDAHRDDGKFVGNYAETSGVSAASMVMTNASIGSWTTLLEKTTNDDWNASFKLSGNNYDIPTFPKNVYFGGHDMPGYAWYGESGMFVDAEIVASDEEEHRRHSGIAWQMKGNGDGCVYFNKSEGPSGLEEVTFKAHMSQSISFGDFSYWYGSDESGDSFSGNNYTLVVPSLLSRNTKTSIGKLEEYDFAPGASMSVVGYYTPWQGCYEARAERNSDDGIQMSIYKWYLGSYGMTNKCLVTHWFEGATFEQEGNSSAPKMHAMLLSLGEDDSGKTTVIAGLTTRASEPNSDYFDAGDGVYNVVCVQDGDKPLTKGSYGVLSSNCEGWFYYPRQRNARIQKSALAGSGDLAEYYKDKQIASVGTYSADACQQRLSDSWFYPPMRSQWFESGLYTRKYAGVRPQTNYVQSVGVYIKERGNKYSDWTLFASNAVPGYGFDVVTVPVHTNADCDVKLATGSLPIDVTVWEIAQKGWRGANIDGIGTTAKIYDFVYTQANVEDVPVTEDGSETNRVATLQPARALPGTALSIRSPLLTNGLGMVTFSYATNSLREECEIWVQAATNGVRGSLASSTGYTFTTNEVDIADSESEPFGVWLTLKRYTYEDLINANGQISYYCGWHSSKSKMLEGVFRITVAPNVVVEAQSKAMSDPEWGSISITGMEVHDEPALDDGSWFGWNLRTLGDASDGEKRMFLPDIKLEGTATGLSSALNNSATKDIAGDTPGIEPAIQSPTFGGDVSVGSVRFRARLYETNAVITSLTNATVTLYGSADGSAGNWHQLTNYTVSSTVYRIFEYSTAGDEYKAVKFEMKGVKGGTYEGGRVLLDEIVVSERAGSSVSFVYARPFRDGLNSDKVIDNILSPDQQPLSGESWGVQTKITYDAIGGDIDAEKGFKVYFRYFKGTDPWGYDGGWDGASGASDWAELKQVGKNSDLTFRSSVSRPATMVTTVDSSMQIVQYMLKVEYYMKGKAEVQSVGIKQGTIDDTISGDGWTTPSWYWPVDLNTNEQYGAGTSFSPYTILDPVSPGRVWINEVNYNDGLPAQTGGTACYTNQFIEIAVPWGVDLTGWKLYVTGMNYETAALAELGKNGVPSSKKSGNRSGDYDFLVLQSPETSNAGGIKGTNGLAAADGTWIPVDKANLSAGTFQFRRPYQFELYRPSGILEHQFVIDGTNTYRTSPTSYAAYGWQYDGTNFVRELNAADPSPKRFYAEEEKARKSDGETWSSVGVTGGAHGEEGGWSSEMRFTPGSLNEGQDELSGWYLRPIGAAVWVYAKSTGPHVRQSMGEDTSQDTFVVVGSGSSTNVLYDIAPWYAISNVAVWTEGGATNLYAAGKTGSYRHWLNNITQTTYVVASEMIDPQIIGDDLLDPSDRYAPAIMSWLEGGMSNGEPFENPNGPISLGYHTDLHNTDVSKAHRLPLKAMYWLDLDPTKSNWWVRANFTDDGAAHPTNRLWNPSGVQPIHLVNDAMTVKMYYSNDTGRAGVEVRGPNRLQGMGGEQSDVVGNENWTSETFKVMCRLKNGGSEFVPMRRFVFHPGSFAAKGAENEFESDIEILDPTSLYSPGPADWKTNSTDNFYFQFSLDEQKETGAPVEMLEENSTYDFLPVDN